MKLKIKKNKKIKVLKIYMRLPLKKKVLHQQIIISLNMLEDQNTLETQYP